MEEKAKYPRTLIFILDSDFAQINKPTGVSTKRHIFLKLYSVGNSRSAISTTMTSFMKE